MPLLNTADGLFVGSSAVSALYQGNSLVWSPPASGGSPPAFKASGAYIGGDDHSSVALAYPPNVVANDLLIADIYRETTSAPTTPSGWQLMQTVSNGSLYRVDRFWKRATGPTSGTQTFTWSGTLWSDAVMHSYSGVVTTGTPFEIIATPKTQGDNLAVTSPAISGATTGPNQLVLWTIHHYWGGQYINLPSGWDAEINAGGGATSVFSRAFPNPTSFGPLQATNTLSPQNDNDRAKSASLVALIPA